MADFREHASSLISVEDGVRDEMYVIYLLSTHSHPALTSPSFEKAQALGDRFEGLLANLKEKTSTLQGHDDDSKVRNARTRSPLAQARIVTRYDELATKLAELQIGIGKAVWIEIFTCRKLGSQVKPSQRVYIC